MWPQATFKKDKVGRRMQLRQGMGKIPTFAEIYYHYRL